MTIPRTYQEALSILIKQAPTYRDYTGTDYDTCAYCGEPVENEWQPHNQDCPWLLAKNFAEDQKS